MNRRSRARLVGRLAISLAIVTSWLLLTIPLVSAAPPEFRLVPDRGTCPASPQYVAVRSANFPPGHAVIRVLFPQGTSLFMDFVYNGIVGPAGTLPAHLYLAFCEPTTPDGTIITFEVWSRPEPIIPGNIILGQLLAATTFTVDRAAGPLPFIPPPPPGLPNTGAGGMTPPPLGVAAALVVAVVGIGAGGYAERRRLARARRSAHR